MGQLYYHLGRGREPAVALFEAKRALRADPRWNRPHLWSAYVLIGEAPPVASRRYGGRLLLALVALLAVGALMALRLGRR